MPDHTDTRIPQLLKALVMDFSIIFAMYEGRVLLNLHHKPSGASASIVDITDVVLDPEVNPYGLQRYQALTVAPEVLS